MAIVTASIKIGSKNLASHGKHLVSASMYQKGIAFLAASELLRKSNGHEFVVLHLIGQGIENILKGVLLAIDYDKYWPKLRNKIGHNLLFAAETASEAARIKPISTDIREELSKISIWYSKHVLRYGNHVDLLVSATSISRNRILRRILAVVRLVSKKQLFPREAI